jgi:hypothetical protein
LIRLFSRAGKRNSYWQQNNHPIELSNNRLAENTLAYIHNNPVVAGAVAVPELYVYSNADYVIPINFQPFIALPTADAIQEHITIFFPCKNIQPMNNCERNKMELTLILNFILPTHYIQPMLM